MLKNCHVGKRMTSYLAPEKYRTWKDVLYHLETILRKLKFWSSTLSMTLSCLYYYYCFPCFLALESDPKACFLCSSSQQIHKADPVPSVLSDSLTFLWFHSKSCARITDINVLDFLLVEHMWNDLVPERRCFGHLHL